MDCRYRLIHLKFCGTVLSGVTKRHSGMGWIFSLSFLNRFYTIVHFFLGSNGSIDVDFIGDGASMSELKELVQERGLAHCVNFLGAMSRKNIYEKLCNYDLLVQPSRDEGFGLTVAEGMAAGVPVLVSNLAGPMEVIANGRYGAMFELGTNEVDNCVLQIAEIKDNYGHYKHLAEGEALDFVKKNFDVARVAYKYIEGYKM